MDQIFVAITALALCSYGLYESASENRITRARGDFLFCLGLAIAFILAFAG